MEQPPGTSIWDAIRGWADAAGLLLPPDEAAGAAARPRVPASVCDNCPICQAAATLDQVNPEIFTELTDVARNLIGGLGSALAAATEQRLSDGTGQAVEEPDYGWPSPPPRPAPPDPDDPSI